jgi:hypothetical protein
MSAVKEILRRGCLSDDRYLELYLKCARPPHLHARERYFEQDEYR